MHMKSKRKINKKKIINNANSRQIIILNNTSVYI